MSDDTKFRIGSLGPGNPLMEPLGRYFAEFATLEFGLVLMFARLLGHGDDNDVAMAVFKHIKNISTRIEIVRDTARAAKLKAEVVDAVNLLCDEFVKTNARRNLYAHGVYEHADNGDVRIKTYVMSAGRKQQTIDLTSEMIEKDITQVQMNLVIALAWAGKIPLEDLRASREARHGKTTED